LKKTVGTGIYLNHVGIHDQKYFAIF